MRSLILATGFVAALGLSASVVAQTAAGVVGTAPGMAGAAQTVTVTATITAIDPATREVTMKGPRGNELTIVAGPEVKNFAQMKVGDQVTAKYVEAITLELKKGGGKAVSATQKTDVAGAKAGASPAGMAARQTTVIADVVALDPATQTVTLKGPQRTVELKVKDPAQFKLIAKGDQVEATYTEALAVAVEPVKPATK